MKANPSILAARHYAPTHLPFVEGDCDIVSVSDVIVNAHIGIHPPEQGAAQRVRISLSVGVKPRRESYSEDINSVVSYDYLLDGISTVTGNGHTQLAETMAERLAEWCLRDARVVFVRARVEKLDRIPDGRLSIEILRRRPPGGPTPLESV
jgi:dihydroneopterin aldolase